MNGFYLYLIKNTSALNDQTNIIVHDQANMIFICYVVCFIFDVDIIHIVRKYKGLLIHLFVSLTGKQ